MKWGLIIAVLLCPILLPAQLPLLLDRSKPELIGVPPNQALTGYFGDVACFYGDSVTVGFNPNNNGYTANRFSTLLCAQYSMIESNYGVGGSQIADSGQSDQITVNTSINNTNVSVWLTGYDDVFFYGTNAAALTDNLATVESMAAWLAIPASLRTPWNATNNFPTPGNIYYSAGWIFLPNALGGLAGSTQPGASASFFFSGNTLLIGSALASSGGGTATLVVGDLVNGNFIPTQTNDYSCVRTSPNTAAGRDYSASLIIVTNLSNAAVHGAIFSADTISNTFFGWFASYSTNQLPKVVLAGTLLPSGGNYANPNLPANFQHGSALAAAQYSLMLSNAAAILSAAKLNVKWVPAPPLTAGTDYFFDGIHPDDSGHLKIKNALQSAF